MSETKRTRTYEWFNPLETAELGKTMSGYNCAVTHRSGKLIAEGRLIHLGKSTALVEADLHDEAGNLLYAHGVSTCMIFKF